jgi:Fe-S cluster biogenesis protein NfuA
VLIGEGGHPRGPRWLERIRCVLIGEGGRIAAGGRDKEAGAVYIRLLIVSRDLDPYH